MAQAEIQFSGTTGLIALVVVVILVLWRIATLGTTFDPALNDAIRAELRNDMGNNLSKALNSSDTRSAEDIARLTALADDSAIQIHNTKVSKPLLSFGGTQKAIVRVAYSLPEQASRDEYWRFDHSTLGGWRYRGASTSISYYLNFF